MTLNARANQQPTVHFFGMRQNLPHESLAAARLRCASRHPGQFLAKAGCGQREEVNMDFFARLSSNSHGIEERPAFRFAPAVLSTEASLLLSGAGRDEARFAAALDDEDEDDDDEEDLDDDDFDENDEEGFDDEDDEEGFDDEDDLDDEDEDFDDEDDEEE
jgi:hypothetical protein